MIGGKLRTEVWLREDLKNLLISLDKANASIGDSIPVRDVALFRAGFRAGIEAMAAAIDVPLPDAPRVTVAPSILGIEGRE